MGGVCGNLTFDDRPDCETCVEDNCCAELQDCDPAGTTDCGKLVVCLNACADGDSACQDACLAADTTMAGLTSLQGLFSCYDTSCKTDPACEYPICDSMLLLADQDCAMCLGTSCCNDIKGCVADMGCADCLTTAPPDAGMPCGTAGSASDTLWQTEQTCETTSCAPVCTFDICGSGLGYNSSGCNYCLTQDCCASFDPCVADTTCNACLQNPTGAGCSTNALFTAFVSCRDMPGAMTCGDSGECK